MTASPVSPTPGPGSGDTPAAAGPGSLVSERGAASAAGRLCMSVQEYRVREARGERWCPRCQDWRPNWRRQYPNKSYCPPCQIAHTRAWHQKRREQTP